MTTERELLEHAAKACGIEVKWSGIFCNFMYQPYKHIDNDWVKWNPLTSSSDCAAMCAKLEIHTQWWNHSVACISNSGNDKRDVKHDGTDDGKEAAWRYAATMVAAKIGGME